MRDTLTNLLKASRSKNEIDDGVDPDAVLYDRQFSPVQVAVLNVCLNMMFADGKITGSEVDEFERFLISLKLDIDIQAEYMHKIRTKEVLPVSFELIKSNKKLTAVLLKELQELANIDGDFDSKESNYLKEVKKSLT